MDRDPAGRDEPAAAVLRRIRVISAFGYVAFAAFTLIFNGFHAFLGLTCSAAVVMINFLWLEQIVNAVLQPSPRLRAWKLLLRSLARYALLGAAISVAIFVVHFDAFGVLLGFSILVVGIMGEAVISAVRSGAD